MATIKLQGNASGSGNVTLTAPNTNSTRTITLPDADMDLGTLGGAGNIKAWVNWNQSGTLAINNSGGVSSITDLALGVGIINYTSAMSTINYNFNGAVNTYATSTRWDVHCIEYNVGNYVRSTSRLHYNTGYGSYAEQDYVRNSGVFIE
jgi:hypothetical protein